MIHFFRDILNGPLYIIVVIFSIIFIMAIIGFLMERKQLEQKKKDSIVVVSSTDLPATSDSTNKEEKPSVIQIEDTPNEEVIKEPYVITDTPTNTTK